MHHVVRYYGNRALARFQQVQEGVLRCTGLPRKRRTKAHHWRVYTKRVEEAKRGEVMPSLTILCSNKGDRPWSDTSKEEAMRLWKGEHSGIKCFHDHRRLRSRKSTIAVITRTRFSRFERPCPSSGNSMYSTGTPFLRTASTICSASVAGTRGSFAP